MSRPARTALVALGLLGAAVLLYALAWQLTRLALDTQATHKSAVLASARTPWDFHPRTPADLLAGRVFGNAQAQASTEGLALTSGSDAPWALGVPLPYPIDLRAFPRVQLSLRVDADTRLRWLLRQRLDAPLLVSAEQRLPAGSTRFAGNLATATWQQAGTGAPAPAPTRAAELRLQLQQASGGHALWQSLRFSPAGAPSAPAVLTLNRAGVEAMLAQRDALREQHPAAVIRTSAGPTPDPATARRLRQAGLIVSLLALCAAFWVSFRPGRPRTTALLQAAGCMLPFVAWALAAAGPAEPTRAWQGGLVGALVLVGVLAWRGHGRDWVWLRWQGKQRLSDWTAAGMSTLLVLAWLALSKAWPHTHAVHSVMTYAAWATAQQLLMLAVLTPRLRRWLGGPEITVVMVAALFALAHAPNALLMQASLVAQALWTWQFSRRPVLLPAVVAHALAGLLLAAALAGLPLRSLEVGARFVQ